MPLDLFPQAQKKADAFISTRPGFGPGLDPTFGEAFGEGLGSLFGTNLGVRVGASKFNAVQSWLDKYQDATGEELQNPEMPSDGATRRRLYAEIADRYASTKEAKPDFAMLPPPTEEQATEAAMADLRRKADEEARFAARPQTFASSAGQLLGGFGSAMADPINLAAMAAFAPSQAGIVAFALREALIAGGSQAVISTATAPLRSEVGLPVNITAETLMAAGGGAVFGAGIRGLAMAWGRYRQAPAAREAPGAVRDSGQPEAAPAAPESPPPVPRYVQDAANVVTRQAAVAADNPFRGAGIEGEVAHARNAAEAEAAIIEGRQPDITVPPPRVVEPAAVSARFDPAVAIDAPQNRPFVRAVLADIPEAERAAFVNRRGTVSPEGFRRAEDAAIAQTFGDAVAVADIPSPMRAALVEAMPEWSAMRTSVSRGTIPAAMDITDDLAAALKLAERSRAEKVPIARLLDTAEELNAPSPATRAIVRLMHRDPELTQPASRGAFARGLKGYADEAARGTTDASAPAVTPDDAIAATLAKAGREDLAAPAEEAVLPLVAREKVAEPVVDDAVIHQLDHLREESPDLMVPVRTVDEFGTESVTMRPVKDMIDEADAEIAAAREIEACASGEMQVAAE